MPETRRSANCFGSNSIIPPYSSRQLVSDAAKFPGPGNFSLPAPASVGFIQNKQKVEGDFPVRGAGKAAGASRERATASWESWQPSRELLQRISDPVAGQPGRIVPCDCGIFRAVQA